ncbi:MAG: zf-HC2 domain-containing protein [Desulfobacterales bacterium]|nr:zf-HC2 domain-containing protein [Pseudomonadota bacterium]MCG2776678.1 zf-HC2 domain-containing protein [Desulfobacterales bacterium]
MEKTCESLGPRLSAYLDGELAEEERRKVKKHLETCQACRELVHELEETGTILKSALSSASESEVDLTGVWEEIEERTHFGPSLWQRMKKLVGKPVVWLPATVATAAVALLLFILPILKVQVPIELSRVESVYSRTGRVMVLQTPESGRPLIWILPEAGKGGSS